MRMIVAAWLSLLAQGDPVVTPKFEVATVKLDKD